MSGVVNVWGGERLILHRGGERLRWWTSGVVNVWFYKGGGERLGWWTSDFTQGVVNVWGGERLGGERLTIGKTCQNWNTKTEKSKSPPFSYYKKWKNTFTTQTFTTPDIHHHRRSPPPLWNQTFTTPDVHHPRHSPPQTFTTPDIHHPRRSPPPILKCDIHHRPTFTTPYNHHPQKKNSPTVQAFKKFLQSKQPCTRAVEGSPSSGWWYLKQSNMESNKNACVHHFNLISTILNKQIKEFKNILVYSPCCIMFIYSLSSILSSLL